MKKIKNKFVYIVILLLIFVIGTAFFITKDASTVDRNSYFTLVGGTGAINDTQVFVSEVYKLEQNDVIQTGKEGFGIIEWGDGSITRLGGSTKLQIKESFVSADRTVVQVLFEIFSGKTWSNVLSYIPEDSYFNQVHQDTEVAVRGTVFTLDVEKDYIFVTDHKVDISSPIGSGSLMQDTPIQLSTQKYISLQDFIQKFQDSEFFKKNKAFDEELYSLLKKEFDRQFQVAEKDLQRLVDLVVKNPNAANFNKLLSAYQEFHFLAPNRGNSSFQDKVTIKELLISSAADSTKNLLASSYFFDFMDVIDGKEYNQVGKMTNFMVSNKELFSQDFILDYLKNLDIHSIINKTIQSELESVKESFGLGIEIGGQFIDGIDRLDRDARQKLYELQNTVNSTATESGRNLRQNIKNIDITQEIQNILGSTDIQNTSYEDIIRISNDSTQFLQQQSDTLINNGQKTLNDTYKFLESQIQ